MLFGKKNENIIIQPFILMIRTSLLNNWIKKLASYNKDLSRKLFNLGVVVGSGLIIYFIYFFLRNLGLLFEKSEQAAGFVLLLPGLTISLNTLPYILVAVVVALITHELAHGIACSIDGIPIKSTGVLLAVIMPGAFVEIDENRLKKAKLMTKLRVFAAGAYTNMIAWAIVTLLLTNFALTISPFYNSNSSGVIITDLVENGAAEKAGLKEWDAIYSLNGSNIEGINSLSDYMADIAPNTLLIANTSSGIFKIKTQPHTQNSSRAAIGVYPFDNYEPNFNWLSRSLPYHLLLTEMWASIIFFFLALINMSPIYPLDGGKFLNSIFEKYLPRYSKLIMISLSIFSFVIIAANFVISTLIFGFIRV